MLNKKLFLWFLTNLIVIFISHILFYPTGVFLSLWIFYTLFIILLFYYFIIHIWCIDYIVTLFNYLGYFLYKISMITFRLVNNLFYIYSDYTYTYIYKILLIVIFIYVCLFCCL